MKNKFQPLYQLLQKYDSFEYLSGIYIDKYNLAPKRGSLSGFLVFKTTKKKNLSILKVVNPSPTPLRFISPLDKIRVMVKVYKDLHSVKKYIPKLISYNLGEYLSYVEFEFLENYKQFGNHDEFYNLTQDQIKTIIAINHSFHQSTSELVSLAGSSLFRYDYKYYKRKIDILIKEVWEETSENTQFVRKINSILDYYKKELNECHTVVIGDRNPSHYLQLKDTVKTIDLDTTGLANASLDYVYIYLIILMNNPNMTKFFLKQLRLTYLQDKRFILRFNLDLIIRIFANLLKYAKKNNISKVSVLRLYLSSILKKDNYENSFFEL